MIVTLSIGLLFFKCIYIYVFICMCMCVCIFIWISMSNSPRRNRVIIKQPTQSQIKECKLQFNTHKLLSFTLFLSLLRITCVCVEHMYIDEKFHLKLALKCAFVEHVAIVSAISKQFAISVNNYRVSETAIEEERAYDVLSLYAKPALSC